MNAILSANDLSLIRGERCLFRGVEFALNAGELLRVEGANGSGKTSLLRLLAGLTHAETGTVRWRGTPVARMAQEYRASLVWLGHKVGCKLDLTPLDNLRFEQSLRPAARADAGAALAQLGIGHVADLPMRVLSAGQQRRVALARLVQSGASLWLMDEPFTNLDRDGRVLVEELIGRHLAGGGLCVIASHQALSIDVAQHRVLL